MVDRIRKISTTTGEIHSIIRTGNQLPANAALQGMAVSANGTIYAVDSVNHVLYRVFEDGRVAANTAVAWGQMDDQEGQWEQVAAKLNDQVWIRSLVSHNGNIYGGTGNDGRLFRWNGVDAWEQVAAQLNGQEEIYALVSHNGNIYGGTSNDGRLFRWNGVDAWEQVAAQLDDQRIRALVVHDGNIYAGTDFLIGGGQLFRWNGVDEWESVADQLGSETTINSLVVHDGSIYGGTSSHGLLFRWNGVDAWEQVAAQLNDQVSIHSLVSHNGSIYGGTSNDGLLFRWNGTDEWEQVAAQYKGETFISSLVVHGGRIYGGTYNEARLFRWNGIDEWESVSDQLEDQLNIASLVSHDGSIYGGTYDGGRLFRSTPTLLGGLPQIGDFGTSGDVSTSGIESSDGLDARVDAPYGVSVDRSENVYIADWGNDKIRRINHGRSQTFAGTGVGGDAVNDNGLLAQFTNPRGVSVDAAGIVYVADTGNHKIKKIWPSGKTVTLAGSTQGFANGQGASAQFDTPVDLVVDATGKVYVADQGNNRIRRIDVDGNVTTMAGYSSTGLVDGQGNEARFSSALGSIAIEPNSRTVWILDMGNQIAGIPGNIRRMTENGNVTTYSTWQSGTTGSAAAIAVDNSGFLYFLEQHV